VGGVSLGGRVPTFELSTDTWLAAWLGVRRTTGGGGDVA
jgi:hypothetical protein